MQAGFPSGHGYWRFTNHGFCPDELVWQTDNRQAASQVGAQHRPLSIDEDDVRTEEFCRLLRYNHALR